MNLADKIKDELQVLNDQKISDELDYTQSLEEKFLKIVRSTFIKYEGKTIRLRYLTNTDLTIKSYYSKEFRNWCRKTYSLAYESFRQVPLIKVYYSNKRLYARYNDCSELGDVNTVHDISDLPDFNYYIFSDSNNGHEMFTYRKKLLEDNGFKVRADLFDLLIDL